MSTSTDKPRIVLSLGDPNGIGPEVILKCLSDPSLQESCSLKVVGPESVFSFYQDHLGYQDHSGRVAAIDFEPVPTPDEFEVRPGMIDSKAGEVAMLAVSRAVTLCSEGKADAMVTAPISKEAISLAGYDFPGHTEFIADQLGAKNYLMMMVSDRLRVGLVTAHIPLRSVSERVTGVGIRRTVETMDRSLKLDFGIQNPLIAVLGLNPHAGDGGVLGTEDRDLILPTIIQARENGFNLIGPLPADGFFGSSTWQKVDGVVAMYHDQVLIPFKALSFGSGVNFTAGLPIVRTSPDHGTAFDIAGVGIASETSLKKAIEYAINIVQKRRDAIEIG